MAERLIIQEFAGIKTLDITLNRINILIGPQASGKSICAKLCFYFKETIKEMVITILQDEGWDQFVDRMRSKFSDFFVFSAWQNEFSNIRYELDSSWIAVSASTNETLKFEFSQDYQLEFEQLKTFWINFDNQLALNTSKYNSDIHAHMKMIQHASLNFNTASVGEQLFIPAGRSFFANFQSRLFNILTTDSSIDPFLLRFGEIYENSRNWLRKHRHFPYSQSQSLELLLKKIVLGRYVNHNGKDCLENSDGRIVEIAASSSGQQEALPMVMILESLLGTSSVSRKKSIYIEEPEAHLFPSTQGDIVNLIAEIFNTSNKIDLQFFITTHSPYILAVFNNLIEGGLLYEELPEVSQKELELIMPKYKVLDSKQMRVYSLENGYCRSIISEETGLIDATIIDQVSDDLSIEFDQLLDLVDIR